MKAKKIKEEVNNIKEYPIITKEKISLLFICFFCVNRPLKERLPLFLMFEHFRVIMLVNKMDFVNMRMAVVLAMYMTAMQSVVTVHQAGTPIVTAMIQVM